MNFSKVMKVFKCRTSICLKADLEENNEKLIQLEQELFEHKSIELELLRTIKELEEKLDSLG